MKEDRKVLIADSDFLPGVSSGAFLPWLVQHLIPGESSPVENPPKSPSLHATGTVISGKAPKSLILWLKIMITSKYLKNSLLNSYFAV